MNESELERPALKDVPCAFCGASVVRTLFVSCAACEVPVHHDCWTASCTCPAYGCGSTAAVDPALVIYRRPRLGAADTALVVPASQPDPAPAGVAARLTKLNCLRALAEREVRTYEQRFACGIVLGLAAMVGGVLLKAPALIFAGIFSIAGGMVYFTTALAAPARRLHTITAEVARLELEAATSE